MVRPHRRDDQPEVEVLDLGGGDDGTLTPVTLRPRWSRRGAGTPGDPNRRAAVLVGLVAVALVVVQVVGGGGRDGTAGGGGTDPGERAAPTTPSTSRPRTTTTRSERVVRPTPPPTTEPAVTSDGPVLPEAAGMGLLLSDGRGWTLVDLATGEQRVVDLPRDAWGAVAVGPGRVAVPGPTGTVVIDLDGVEVATLRRADHLIPVPGTSLLWLIGYSYAVGGPSFEGTLVDVDRAQALWTVSLGSTHVVGAGSAGLVASVYDATYVITPQGETRYLGPGIPLAVGAAGAVVATCGQDGRCGLVVVDLETGGRRPLPMDGFPPGLLDSDGHRWVRAGPDGQVMIIQQDLGSGDRWSVVAVDGQGRVLADVAVDHSAMDEPTILPDWSGVLLRDGSSLRWMPFDGSGTQPHELPGRYEAVFVVPVELAPTP